MNKQEIEQALQWAKEVLNHQKFERATYEDICGTGDLAEEERVEVYEDMDSNIRLFETIKEALTQQLTNGWIPASEPPKEIGFYIFQLTGGKTHEYWYEEEKLFPDNIHEDKPLFTLNHVIAWHPLPEPYKG